MEEIIKYITEEIGWKLLWGPAAHFGLSGCVGLLVYWLTSTMLLRYSSGDISIRVLPKVGFGIHRFSLSLALAFAVWFHILEDFVLNWF